MGRLKGSLVAALLLLFAVNIALILFAQGMG